MFGNNSFVTVSEEQICDHMGPSPGSRTKTKTSRLLKQWLVFKYSAVTTK